MEKRQAALGMILITVSCGTAQEVAVAPATVVQVPQTSVITPALSVQKPQREEAQQRDPDADLLMTAESADGLRIEELRNGTRGRISGDEVLIIHYVATLPDGTVFDSSRDRGQPFRFRTEQVIRGLAQGMKGMRVGGLRRITIPPALGYGDRKIGKIPPGSTLSFEVELLGIEERSKQP